MRALWLSLLLSACISDHATAIELRPPRAPDGGPDVPAEVVAHEVRIYRLAEGADCPDLSTVATAARPPGLEHAQTFAASEGMGEAFGEIAPGRYGVAALSRDAECGVHLFGCRVLQLGEISFETFVIELERVTASPGCGACRSCREGVCEPVEATCR